MGWFRRVIHQRSSSERSFKLLRVRDGFDVSTTGGPLSTTGDTANYSTWGETTVPATPQSSAPVSAFSQDLQSEQMDDISEAYGTLPASELASTKISDDTGDERAEVVDDLSARVVEFDNGTYIGEPGSARTAEFDDDLSDDSGDEIEWNYRDMTSSEAGDWIGWRQNPRILDASTWSNTDSTYKDLGIAATEIRLLILLPAPNQAEKIRCTLIKDNLGSKAGAYEALSYTWGEGGDRRIIYVNDRPFPITPNLFVALKYLRKAEESRTLWIDAICIDQHSLLEKTHQVGMMRDIYRSAFQVLVWLGKSDKEIRRTIDFLRQKKTFQMLTEDELAPFVPGLKKIFKRSWWSRIWVVQEVLVATQPPLLGSGHTWLPWDDFEMGMTNLRRQHTFGDIGTTSGENPVAIYDLGLLTSETFHDGHNRERMSKGPSL